MSQATESGCTIDESTGKIVFDDATKKIYDDEATKATSTRLTSNNIQGYDEIVSISEESINTTLRLRFSNLLKKKKDKRLRQFNHSLPDLGAINAEMAAPHLKLAVAGAPEAVKFFINFSKGSFQYWVGRGSSARQRSQPVDGWCVALNVDFSTKQLAAVPKAIEQKISLLKVNTYSVSQLLLGLSAASLASFDQNASSFPGISGDKDVQITVIHAFKDYFEPYLEWLKTGPFSVLGYTIQVDQNASHDNLMPPSFPPTKVRVRTQAYSPRTQAFSDRFPENPSAICPTRGGLDAIIFQEMTETNDWPNGTYDVDKAGNWITGDIHSSLVLSKSVFWDRYLALKFSELNLQLLTVANNMYHWAKWSNKEQSNPWAINPGNKPTEAKWTNTPSGAEYKWNGKQEEHTSGGTRDDTTTTITNTMSWVPGSDTVKVECGVTSTRDYYAPSMQITHSFSHKTTLKWNLTLTLGTIKAGELEAVISYDKPTITSKRDDSRLIFWSEHLAKHYEDTVNTDITNNLKIDIIKKDLTEILNGRTKFVFPGAGDFAMRDPKFNQNGDLFITLNLEGKAIEVDNDFELQVAAPGQAFDGKWVKVARDGDGADLVLTDDPKQATKFQLSNGNLIIDVGGMPAGQHADSRDNTQGTNDQDYILQDIFFDGPDKEKTYEKLEFSTAGSGFFYSTDKGANWWPRFVLDGEKLRFFVGVPPEEGATLPFTPFLLNAIY